MLCCRSHHARPLRADSTRAIELARANARVSWQTGVLGICITRCEVTVKRRTGPQASPRQARGLAASDTLRMRKPTGRRPAAYPAGRSLDEPEDRLLNSCLTGRGDGCECHAART